MTRGLLLLALTAASVAEAQTVPRKDPGVLWLHAWTPEMGPLPTPHPADAAVVRIARRVLAGDFVEANRQYAALSSASDGSNRTLLAWLGRELIRRKSVLASGGRILSHETYLHHSRSSAAIRARIQEAGPAPVSESLQAAYSIVEFCLVDGPSYRSPNARPQVATSIRDARSKRCAELLAAVRSVMSSSGLSQSAMSLLEHFVVAQQTTIVQQDVVSARKHWQSGLRAGKTLGDPRTIALWLLYAGDLEAARDGSVVSLGVHLASDTRSGHSGEPERLRPVDPRRLEQALKLYEEAAQMNAGASDPISRSSFDLRRAYVAHLRDEASAAGMYCRTAERAGTEAEPLIAAMAFAACGLLSRNQEALAKAFETGIHQDHLGSNLSVAELGMGWVKQQRASGKEEQALPSLIMLANAAPLSHQGLFGALSEIESRSGRTEASLYWRERRIESLKAWLKQHTSSATDADIKEDMWNQPDPSELQTKLLYESILLAEDFTSLELSEFLPAWPERRRQTLQSIRELSLGTPFQQKIAQMVTSGRSEAVGAIDFLSRALANPDCRNILREVEKSGVLTAPPQSAFAIAVLSFASRCKAEYLQTARARLRAFDPIKPVELAISKVQSDPDGASQLQLLTAVNRAVEHCASAETADDGEILLRWTESLLGTAKSGLLAPDQMRDLMFYRARAFSLTGNGEEARRILSDLIENSLFWTSDSFSDRQRVLFALLDIEVARGDSEGALAILESITADDEAAFENQTGVRAQDAETAELAMHLRQQALGQAFNEKRIRELYARARSSAPTPASLLDRGEVRRVLESAPKNATVLVFVPRRSRVVIWRKDPGKALRMILVPAESETLDSLQRRFRHKVETHVDGWEPLSRELHRLLIAPVGPLEKDSTLIIVGSERLGDIPFEAIGPEPDKLMVHRHRFVYTARLSRPAVHARAPGSAEGPAMVIGFNGESLKNPESEATSIAKLLKTEPIVGSAATLERLRASVSRTPWIHFSTHGILDQQNPFLSHLTLRDGRVYAWELLRDARAANMIVFSACNTRRTPTTSFTERRRIEHRSLAAFATRAGVPRILSTLWEASDDTSQPFMETFYSEVARNPRDVARAVQQAKLRLIRDFGTDPYFSANFVLVARDVASVQ